jgi:hypothetical protein
VEWRRADFFLSFLFWRPCSHGSAQDQKSALSEAEVSEGLGLHTLKDRQWHICKTAATKNVGLEEAMTWLSNAITGNAPK